MGRRRLEMKRIEDKSSRQVTFSKRRSGLIKKARELSILCDVELALLVFSSRGRLYNFCSGHSLTSIVERYKSHSQEASTSKAAGDGPGFESDNAGTRSYTELLQIVESFSDGSDAEDTMSVTDLVQLENEFSSALQKTRSRKNQLVMESIMTLKEKDRLLREEKEMLEREVASLPSNDAAANCGGQNSKRYKGNDHQDDDDDAPPPPQRPTLNLLG